MNNQVWRRWKRGKKGRFGKRGRRLCQGPNCCLSQPNSLPALLSPLLPPFGRHRGPFSANIPQCSATPHLAPLSLSRFQIDYMAPTGRARDNLFHLHNFQLLLVSTEQKSGQGSSVKHSAPLWLVYMHQIAFALGP